MIDPRIVSKDKSDLKPGEISLGYLFDTQFIKSVKEHSYDLQINYVDISRLDFLSSESKANLRSYFKTVNVLSIDRIPKLQLLGLSSTGLGLVSDFDIQVSNNTLTKYSYLNSFIDCVNEAIDEEERQERYFSGVWQAQGKIIKTKFDNAQCSNKLGIAPLITFRHVLNQHLKTLGNLIRNPERQKILAALEDVRQFFITYHMQNKNLGVHGSVFETLGMSLSESGTTVTNATDLLALLNQFYYFLKYTYLFLRRTLSQIRRAKVHLLSDIFNIDGKTLKAACLNGLKEFNYEDYNEYNINLLYEFFRLSLIQNIQDALDIDIKRRQRIDAVFQYTPSGLGFLVFIVALVLLLVFNYTLLKEMGRRDILLIVFGIICFFASFQVVNLYRNAIQFKRPKRRKFSIVSLICFGVITAIFFSLYTYYINRFDGYDETYYYINTSDTTITIDGLLDKSKSEYVLPFAIDGKNITLVTKNAFKNKKKTVRVDLSNTIAVLGEGTFQNNKNLETVILSDRISEIPANAFRNCTSLKSISLDNIDTIGNNAFLNAKELKDIELNSVASIGEGAFLGCESLGDIEFGDVISIIPKNAFKNCTSLYFDDLPVSLTAIGESAFENCGKLTSLCLTDKLTGVGKNAFKGCEEIKTFTAENFAVIESIERVFGSYGLRSADTIVLNNCTIVANEMFADYENLTSLTISGDIERIGDAAFRNCGQLKSFFFEGNCTFIGKDAFLNCSSLTEIAFENLTIDRIRESTFEGCTSLKGFDIPSTTVRIDKRAFYDCNALSSIIIPDTVSKIGADAFGNCANIELLNIPYIKGGKLSDYFSGSAIVNIKSIEFRNSTTIPKYYFDNCRSLVSLKINENPTEIGDYAFRDCVSLSDFSFISSATKLGKGSFENCESLDDISLNDAIKKIPDYAFRSCVSLSALRLPSELTTIGKEAFFGCSGIESLEIGGKVRSIKQGAFELCTGIKSVSLPLIKEPIVKFLGTELTSKLTTIDITVSPEYKKMADNFFDECVSLQTINIDGELSSIGKNAFNNCVAMVTFDIPSSVTSIGNYAFNGCTSLKNVSVPASIIDVGKEIFRGCSAIENVVLNTGNAKSFNRFFNNNDIGNLQTLVIENTDTIKKGFFKDYTNLKTFDFSHYNNIENEAFKNSGLTQIDLSGITVLGKSAFEDCASLETVVLDEGLTSVSDSVFRGCSALKNLSGTDGLESIGANAFRGCTSLEHFDFSKITSVGSSAFRDNHSLSVVKFDSEEISLKSNAFKDSNAIKDLSVPSLTFRLSHYFEVASLERIRLYGIERLGAKTFSGCESLQEVELEGNLTTIEAYTFDGLTNIKRVVLPSSVRQIKKYAFRNCSSLSEINLPVFLSYIGKRAFLGCVSLGTITLPSNIGYVGKEAFANTQTELLNTNDFFQDHLSKWHSEWNSREVNETVLSFLEDISLYIYISVGTILLTTLIIVIVRVRRARYRKKYPHLV